MPSVASTAEEYKPLTFTGYPSCEDCLAWSEEGLAIAISENVQIIERPLQGDEPPPTISLRVDLFNPEEWPEKPLATIPHLSIGEEQSYSVAVAVDWSPPGLGIHRRSVLAVLTSNLLLSFWESDGSPRKWRRTCIVNHHLPTLETPELDSHDYNVGQARRLTRIRSYTWFHPLHDSNAAKWGHQFLAVIDDQENVTIFQVRKSNMDEYGTWSILPVHRFSLSCVQSSSFDANDGLTELQRQLTQKASIKDVRHLPWTADTQAILLYRRYHQNDYRSVHLAFQYDATKSSFSVQHSDVERLQDADPVHGLTNTQQEHGFIHGLDERPLWRDCLKKIVADFDKVNSLNGLYRIRFWGYALSPREDIQATCVSLHPRDMHEYTSNVLEKCRIIFRPMKVSYSPLHRPEKSLDDVLSEVLSFIITHLSTSVHPFSPFDLTFLQLLYNWLVKKGSGGSHNDVFKNALENRHIDDLVAPPGDTNLTEVAQTTPEFSKWQSSPPEICDTCNAPIDLKIDNYSSICENGHIFSRCNLSLISIQEPGISKYCSQCKRQFMNLSKLEPPPGQGLVTKIFQNFDVCPYCDQRFRG